MHLVGMRNHKDHNNAKINSSTRFDLVTKHFQNDSIDMTEDTHITQPQISPHESIFIYTYVYMYIYTHICMNP